MTERSKEYKIAVYIAWLEGKKIECRPKNYHDYSWIASVPVWDWDTWDYRIAEESRKPREWSARGTDIDLIGLSSTLAILRDGPVLGSGEKVRVREILPENME